MKKFLFTILVLVTATSCKTTTESYHKDYYKFVEVLGAKNATDYCSGKTVSVNGHERRSNVTCINTHSTDSGIVYVLQERVTSPYERCKFVSYNGTRCEEEAVRSGFCKKHYRY